MPATVLVTDGEQRAALAAVRSLGRAGYRVIVCSARRRCLAGSSRYTSHTFGVPDPLRTPDAFSAAVIHATRHWRPDVVLPVTDATLLSLLPEREELVGVIPFGDVAVVRRAADKCAVLREAAAMGLSVPRQVILAHPVDVQEATFTSFSWPLVVKPGRSVADGPGTQVRLGVRWVRGIGELRETVCSVPESAFPVLVQERIVGPGIGIFLLRWDGRTLAVFAHRRIREKPPSGGVSVCSASVAPDHHLVAQAEALLTALSWQGPAMVEFKRDAATGEAFLMEVNGRLWGSLQLAVDAGVDFPRLLVEAALGLPPAVPPTWRVGVRMRWWWGEVDHLMARLRPADDAPAFGEGRWKAIRDFLFPGQGTRNEVLRWDDPGPFLRETVDWIAALGRGA